MSPFDVFLRAGDNLSPADPDCIRQKDKWDLAEIIMGLPDPSNGHEIRDVTSAIRYVFSKTAVIPGSPIHRISSRINGVQFLPKIQDFLPLDFHMNIVEIRIVQIALVSTDHSRWERAHLDFLSIFNDPAEGLKLDEAVKEVNHAITQISTYSMNTEVWATELPHTSRMEPLGAVLIFRR